MAAAQTQTPTVGSGAPNAAIQQAFIAAYSRNGFPKLVGQPLADVKKLGAGLVQEFPDSKNNATNKYALVKANASAPPMGMDVLQMYPALYAYYTSVGTNTAGYPTIDTLNCPGLVSQSGITCQYQLFDKPYALFVYSASVQGNGTQFAVADPYYTKWQSLGGVVGPGPAVNTQQNVTSYSGAAATVQVFDQGAVVSITSGPYSGRLVGINSPVWAVYAPANTWAGVLGLPITDEVVLPDGSHRQTFEGGSIQYTPGSAGSIRFPIATIILSPQALQTVNAGDTFTVQAVALDRTGSLLTDRTITWTVSNPRVLSLQPSGYSATVKAAAAGSASITASGEGAASQPLQVIVNAVCCGIGDGSPTPAIQAAFLDVVARNHLNLRIPTMAPVQRSGNGYVQRVQDAATGAVYLLAVSDRSHSGFLVSGALLAKYNDLGGPPGPLGYPASDPTATARQLFENQAALAGSPVQLVAGPFLTKWSALGFETGAAGSPTSGASSVLSFRATLGQLQSFQNGAMLMATTGPLARQVFFAGGLIFTAYAVAGAAIGDLGLPVSDEYAAAGRRRQDFEGGFIDYAPGDTMAQVHPGDRKPLVTATPGSVVAGSRVRLAAGGFDAGSTLRVSITGQPDFTVATLNGAYTWETIVPASAKNGVVSIHAVDAVSGAAADGSYSVRAVSDVRYQIVKVSGDNQAALPGAVLAAPLSIIVRDDTGTAAPGIAVAFSSSPGSSITPASTVTDSNGMAQAVLRLPPADGIALVTVEAAHQLATFSAQALHASLSGFPQMSQNINAPLGNGSDTIAQKGALLTAVAAVIRYFQNRGDIANANGFADPQTLNQFLKTFCTANVQGGQICDGFLASDSNEQFVNIWRVPGFAGGSLDVSVAKPDLNMVRDLVARGTPVILELAISLNGSYAGAHYVIATGVTGSGSIAVMDPNPAFNRTNLADYFAGFAAPTGAITGALDQLIVLTPRPAAARGFAVYGKTAAAIISPAGTCGSSFVLNPAFSSAGPSSARLFEAACDGALDLYQVDIQASDPSAPVHFVDLADPGNRVDLGGSGAASYKVFRSGLQWTTTQLDLNFTADSIVNAASFTPDLAPGSLFAVFGAGMASAAAPATIDIAGVSTLTLAQTPFQINGQIPPDIPPGNYTLTIHSPFGSGGQPVQIKATSPAIFSAGPQQAAIVNQDGTLNTVSSPVQRGQALVIFCTGLGATASQANLEAALAPVTVVLNGAPLSPFFAGLTPGFIGLYQVNVIVPQGSAPGLNLPLTVQQAESTSNSALVSIQ